MPSTVRPTRVLIFLNAVLWLGFGVISAAGAHPSYQDPSALRWVMAGLALLTAGFLLALRRLITSHSRLAFWLAVPSFALMTVAALLDEVGLADLVVLIISVLPLALLLKDRAWYLGPV